MNSYIATHLKKSISDHFATFMASLFSMSVVLSCLSLLLLARQNLATMADRWGQDSEITAYLEEELQVERKDQLKIEIENIKDVAAADYISKAKSAERFLSRMGHLSPDFIHEDPKDNPLPAMFDVRLALDLSLSERAHLLKDVADKISGLSGVTEVSFGQGWIENWSQFLVKFNVFTIGAIGFVLLLGLLIVGNATRVSMERRIEEIEVLELVGATASWIRKPFLIEGALLGLFSAMMSLFLSSLINQAVLGYFSDSGWIWATNSGVSLSWLTSLTIVAIGLSFGLLGSYMCVRKINTGWRTGELDALG